MFSTAVPLGLVSTNTDVAFIRFLFQCTYAHTSLMPAVADLVSQEENPVIEVNIQDVDLGMPLSSIPVERRERMQAWTEVEDEL